jgi:hypothetical protein
MNDLPDYELEKTAAERPLPETPPATAAGPWIIGALLIIAVAGALYVLVGGRRQPATPQPARPVTVTETPPRPLGGNPQPVDVPALDDSDPFVRALVRALSSSPIVAAWLATDGLIRNFTVVVDNIAAGTPPVTHLKALRPRSSFRVLGRGGELYVDPQGYERYTSVAQAVASVDPAGAARLYATLKPRIEEAYRDLGYPGRPFDRTLQRAIVMLLETPDVNGPVRVEPKGIGYAFADHRLEILNGPQKELLRMGPQNARVIQAKLREIGLALGIPAEELQLPRNVVR